MSLTEEVGAASSSAVTQHLSELCKVGTLDRVIQKLKAHCDDAVDFINWEDEDGRTAFHWSVGLRSWELAEQLMREPWLCRVVTRDKDGTTPLMSACATDAPALLLGELIDATVVANALEATDGAGNTALLLAGSKGNLSATKRLLQAGAKFQHQNVRGQTCLHRAVSRGSTDVVEELILFAKQKLERAPRLQFLNISDSQGNTALHYASMENNQELGQLLLRNGASRDIANKQGKLFYQL